VRDRCPRRLRIRPRARRVGENAPNGRIPAGRGAFAPSHGANAPHQARKPLSGAFARQPTRRTRRARHRLSNTPP
jgi:hypothetical protein